MYETNEDQANISTTKILVQPYLKANSMELPLFPTPPTFPTSSSSTVELQKIHSSDSKPERPIFELARNGNWAEIDDLLESGKLTDVKTQSSATLLHIAVFQNNLSMVKKLVQRNADINAINNRHQTPLDVYRVPGVSRNNAVEEYLLQYGAKTYLELHPIPRSARRDCLSFWRTFTPAKKAGIEILALGVVEGIACLGIRLATDQKSFKEFFSHAGNYDTLGGVNEALKTNVGMTTFSSFTLAGLIVIAGLYLYNSHIARNDRGAHNFSGQRNDVNISGMKGLITLSASS